MSSKKRPSGGVLALLGMVLSMAAGCRSETAPQQRQVYTVVWSEYSGITVANSDGAIKAQVACPSNCLRLASPRLSRDGSKLSLEGNFLPDQQGRAYSILFVVNEDGTGMREIARVLANCVLEKGNCFLQYHQFDADWSGDGRLVFVVNDSSLAVAQTDGSPARIVYTASETIGQARWGPSDQTITFTTRSVERRLYSIVAADGSGLRQIATRADIYAWAPNGRAIAIESFDLPPDVHTSMFLVAPLTGASTELAKGVPSIGFAWSPSSTEIAFTGTYLEDSMEILTMDGVRFVNRGGVNVWNVPQWSPDGNYLVVLANHAQSDFLAELPRGGGTARIISTGTFASFSIKGSPPRALVP